MVIIITISHSRCITLTNPPLIHALTELKQLDKMMEVDTQFILARVETNLMVQLCTLEFTDLIVQMVIIIQKCLALTILLLVFLHLVMVQLIDDKICVMHVVIVQIVMECQMVDQITSLFTHKLLPFKFPTDELVQTQLNQILLQLHLQIFDQVIYYSHSHALLHLQALIQVLILILCVRSLVRTMDLLNLTHLIVSITLVISYP